MSTLLALCAVLDSLIGIALLIWWIVWSTRMLRLQEKLVDRAAARALQLLQEMHVDTRTLTRRLSE